MLAHAFRAVLITSWIGGSLAVALMLLKPVTKKCFSGNWHYYIWLVVLVTLILPVRIHWPANDRGEIPVVRHMAETAQSDEAVTNPTVPQPAELAHRPAVPKGLDLLRHAAVNRTKLLGMGWLAGAVCMLLFKLYGYLALLRKIKKSSVIVSCPEIETFTDKKITVRTGADFYSPLLTGLCKPVLLLPETIMSPEQLHNVLCHEMTHFKRKDILYKWFAAFVGCVHWFNPVIYFVIRQINIECEISCDLAVVKKMDKEDKMSYVNTILTLLSHGKTKNLPLSTGMMGSKKVLKRRFTMIKNMKKTSKIMSFLSAAVAVLMLSTTVFASGVIQGYETTNIQYEVYNGSEKIMLSHAPFIYDNEYYLPLRDTLSGFGAGNFAYDDGEVTFDFPASVRQGAPKAGRMKIGVAQVWFGNSNNAGTLLRGEPILKDGTTYAPIDFFERAIDKGHIPDFQFNVIRPTEPENYYTKGEEVFIGTALQQDEYDRTHNNTQPIKRIIVDESNKTIAVVPVENQNKENIEQRVARASGCNNFDGYYDRFYGGALFNQNARGEKYQLTILGVIGNAESPCAYIASANMITYPENQYNKEMRTVITNTYGK